MATTYPKESPERELGGRSMIMPIPNPRRSPPRETSRTIIQDGRKRQKLNHPLDGDSHLLAVEGNGDKLPRRPRALASQESGSSDTSASRWYKSAARDATAAPKQLAELDDDPPFYMSNRAPYEPPNFVAPASERLYGKAALSRFDSENEDLRGVIDDLTIENKRLKAMIRTQKTQRTGPADSIQQQDKLFELRIHGLSTEKRRELESLLKNFASGIQTTRPPSLLKSNSNGSASVTSGSNNLGARTTPITDSGYGSISNSAGSNLPQHPPTLKTSNSKNVRTYLKDIPDTLLPRHSPFMSERAKHALIVRRLEQLFIGRQAVPGEHDQPLQQQEISQSAAQADRLQDARENKKRKAEGNRESYIMPPDTKVNLDIIDYLENPESLKRKAEPLSRPSSPDQRPTRPLDLDIHRAQIADDNIAYLRHLGLSSPHVGLPATEGERPWMYVNLLAGLAQLHTLNVTSDMVRKAVKKLSKRFELSQDGYRVRWIGGAEGTKFPAEYEKAMEAAIICPSDSADESGRRRRSSQRSQSYSTSNAAITSNTASEVKTGGLQTSSGSRQPELTLSGTPHLQPMSALNRPTTTSSAFDYKPVVYRPRAAGDVEDALQDSDESSKSPSADSSSLPHSLSQSNLVPQAKEEGVITFFNNPYFCTDFSCDQEPSNMTKSRPAIVGETLGISVPMDLDESPLRHHDGTYFAMQFAAKPFDIEKLSPSQQESFERSLPTFPVMETIEEAGEQETMPMHLKVCGLGGVTPADNFALDVTVERDPLPTSGPYASSKTLPFSRRKLSQRFGSSVVSCRKIDLLPSKLPAPSYVFFTSSSSSENMDLDDDDISEGDTSDTSSAPLVDEQYPAPPAFLQQFSGSPPENMADDDDDENESSEIDLLALARQANPEEIAEQERVYMINQLGGIQRTVEGSLAATVGESVASVASNHGPMGDLSDDEDAELGDNDMSDD